MSEKPYKESQLTSVGVPAPVPDAFMHQMSSFVHGSLTALHILGVAYGIRRKNWLDVAAHTFGVAFSVRATAHHIRMTKS